MYNTTLSKWQTFCSLLPKKKKKKREKNIVYCPIIADKFFDIFTIFDILHILAVKRKIILHTCVSIVPDTLLFVCAFVYFVCQHQAYSQYHSNKRKHIWCARGIYFHCRCLLLLFCLFCYNSRMAMKGIHFLTRWTIFQFPCDTDNIPQYKPQRTNNPDFLLHCFHFISGEISQKVPHSPFIVGFVCKHELKSNICKLWWTNIFANRHTRTQHIAIYMFSFLLSENTLRIDNMSTSAASKIAFIIQCDCTHSSFVVQFRIMGIYVFVIRIPHICILKRKTIMPCIKLTVLVVYLIDCVSASRSRSRSHSNSYTKPATIFRIWMVFTWY